MIHRTLKVELITKFRAVYRRMYNLSVTFLLFDTKLKDERSSIADNENGSPTFVQLPMEMPFGATPLPQIEVAKIFFLLHGH